jgi:YD repeat-containing protein
MSFKTKITYALLFIISINSSGQTVTGVEIQKQYMPNTPLTPSAASLFKFQEIGLNEYNGSANINISLAQLSQIPLNLTYTATSGNRVNDQPGIVGLGWDMNLGTIVQSINDIDDLQGLYFQYFKSRPDFQGYVYPSDYPFSCSYITKLYEKCTTDGTPYPVATEIPITIGNKKTYGIYGINNGELARIPDVLTNGNFDSEPDVFTANFLGQSITFINDFSTLDNKLVFKVLNKKGYLITLNYVNNNDIKFIITAPTGTIYEFNALENIKNQSSVPSATTLVDSRTWKLTKIIEPNKKTSTIEYIDIPNVSFNPSYSQEFTKAKLTGKTHYSLQPFHRVTLDYSGQSLTSFPDYDYIPDENSNGEYTKTFYNISKQNVKLIKSITSEEGKLNFHYSSRTDHSLLKKLDSIVLTNLNNKKIRNVKFAYNYFNTISTNVFTQEPSFFDSNTNIYRLKLNSVTINDQTYNFEYNTQNLPPKNSLAMDFWGYYNGSNQNTSIIPNSVQFKYYSFIGNNGNNLNADENFTKASILQKITYPTKGYTTFEYELNEASNLFYSIQDDNQIRTKGNGLRIKKITNFDSNGLIATAKSYQYFEGKTMLPLLVAKTNSYGNTASHPSSTGYLYGVKVDRLSSNNYFNVSPNGISNYVGYSSVRITESGNTNSGYIEKIFQNREENVVYLDNVKSTNNYSYTNYDIDNGSVLKQTIFNSQNIKVKETTYEYFKFKSPVDYGAKVSFYGMFYDYMANGAITELARYQVSFYPLFGKETLLKNEAEILYFDNKNVTNKIDYEYNSDHLVSKTVKSSINGEFYKEQDSYVTVYEKNILNLPSSKTVTANGKIKEIIHFTYNEVADITVPKRIDVFPFGNSLNAKSVFYDNYDNSGNPVEYHSSNGAYSVVIWGYNKTLPIAKIENATYAQIATALGITTASLNNYNENNLQVINNLRNSASLSNSMLTTYTHIPLIGVTSITDPKGDIIYYNYDNFGKLVSSKDAQGNLISENQYHYKN